MAIWWGWRKADVNEFGVCLSNCTCNHFAMAPRMMFLCRQWKARRAARRERLFHGCNALTLFLDAQFVDIVEEAEARPVQEVFRASGVKSCSGGRWTCVHTLAWSVAPIQECLEFTDTSGTALGKETFNSANGIFDLAIALRERALDVTCSRFHIIVLATFSGLIFKPDFVA